MDMEQFALGTPALVCRWRLANRALPLENRHLRALAARSVNGAPLPAPLVAWAKQHIEWTLEDGSLEHPDGVLMLVVDEVGHAAMGLGPYERLASTTTADLVARARAAKAEAEVTGVSPEDLWALCEDELVWAADDSCVAAGVSSLVADLARTLGVSVRRDAALLESVANAPSADAPVADEIFLASDEHGVVPASDCAGPLARRLADGYRRLLDVKKG